MPLRGMQKNIFKRRIGMKMNKTILTVFLVLLTSTLLFAGGASESEGTGTSGTSEKAKGPVTITGAFEAGRQADAAMSIVPAFEAQYPNIKVEIVSLPYQSMEEKIMRDVSSGTGAYDVVSLFTGNSQIMIKNDWLLPFDEYIEKTGLDTSDFVGSTMDIATLLGQAKKVNPKGNIWGLPYSSDIMMLIYRKDLYQQAGLSVPQSQDEMLEVARKLDGMESDIRGMILCGLDTPGSQVFHDFINVNLNTGGGMLVTEDAEPNVINAGNKKALTLYKTYSDEGLLPKGFLEYSYSEKNNAFAQGLGANMFQWMLACVNAIEDPANSKVSGKIGYAPIPGGTGSGSGWILSVPKTTKNAHEAMTFASYLTNYDSVKKTTMEFGQGPVRKSVIQSEQFAKEYPFAPDLLSALDTGLNQRLVVPGLPIWPKIQSQVNKEVMNGVTGKKTVDQSLQDLHDFIEEELEAAGY